MEMLRVRRRRRCSHSRETHADLIRAVAGVEIDRGHGNSRTQDGMSAVAQGTQSFGAGTGEIVSP